VAAHQADSYNVPQPAAPSAGSAAVQLCLLDSRLQVKAKRSEQAGFVKERMLLERKIAKKRAQVDKKVRAFHLNLLSA